MATKRKARTTKRRRISKAARETARMLLEPPEAMKLFAETLADMTKQVDEMERLVRVLYQHVIGPLPTTHAHLLTEPSPPPTSTKLTEDGS